MSFMNLRADTLLAPSPGDRCGPAVGGLMVEVHVGPLHAADFRQPLQRSVRAHRHRGRHRSVRTVRLLCNLQRPALDVKDGLCQFVTQMVSGGGGISLNDPLCLFAVCRVSLSGLSD